MTSFDEVMTKEAGQRQAVMAAQRQLLESRYDLAPRLDPQAKMSRGTPLCIGATARLAGSVTFEQLATLAPSELRERGLFPYLRTVK
jgi:hypothetical protein